MKSLYVVFWVTVVAVLVLFLSSRAITSSTRIQETTTQTDTRWQHFVISEPSEDLYEISLQKQRNREAFDKYETYSTLAEREKREQERDEEFEEWAEEEREYRERLREERRKKDC